MGKPLNLPEGTKVTVIVVPSFASLRGILKHVQQDSVSLQQNVSKIWSEAIDEALGRKVSIIAFSGL
ncbi:MAG: hypothetical protein NZ805_10245 [Armatimonadetes bacterium]|nr:hypothetical protein [Armatimonadota bacterium]